jgi:probable rRNA maturation factor
MSFTIVKQSKATLPRVPYEKIARDILGQDYDLGLVLCTPATIRKLNQDYRHKDKDSNILSFPYGKGMGEIFINPTAAKAEAPSFGESFAAHLRHLFIHGCLHLKGMTHGSTMDKREKQLVKRFSLS